MIRHLLTMLFTVLIAGLVLSACEPDQPNSVGYSPVAIEAGDECHLCGMIITRFPGPKGEAFMRRHDSALKFCSTRDLFAWLLQPDVTSQVEAVYVHDIGQTDWDEPADSALIDARKAWYVVGSDRTGAMGHTLASFADREVAVRFSRDYGGRVISYDDIDLQLLQSL